MIMQTTIRPLLILVSIITFSACTKNPYNEEEKFTIGKTVSYTVEAAPRLGWYPALPFLF